MPSPPTPSQHTHCYVSQAAQRFADSAENRAPSRPRPAWVDVSEGFLASDENNHGAMNGAGGRNEGGLAGTDGRSRPRKSAAATHASQQQLRHSSPLRLPQHHRVRAQPDFDTVSVRHMANHTTSALMREGRQGRMERVRIVEARSPGRQEGLRPLDISQSDSEMDRCAADRFHQ